MAPAGDEKKDEECKTEAATCEKSEECCVGKDGSPGVCFDYSFMKGCTSCASHNIEADCMDAQNNGKCVWKNKCMFNKGGEKEEEEKRDWMPPSDCKCEATETTDGVEWPAYCATNPNGGKTHVCYVDQTGDKPCKDSKLSTKSKLRYVLCKESASKDSEVEPFKSFQEYKALAQ